MKIDNLGVQEMKSPELKQVNGGGWPAKILGFVLGLLSGPQDIYDEYGNKIPSLSSTGF